MSCVLKLRSCTPSTEIPLGVRSDIVPVQCMCLEIKSRKCELKPQRSSRKEQGQIRIHNHSWAQIFASWCCTADPRLSLPAQTHLTGGPPSAAPSCHSLLWSSRSHFVSHTISMRAVGSFLSLRAIAHAPPCGLFCSAPLKELLPLWFHYLSTSFLRNPKVSTFQLLTS